MWAVTILSIVGVVLNIKKRKECFFIWAFTNAAWCIYDFVIGAYAQAALFAVYFVLAIWGLIEWAGADRCQRKTA
jgi:nicotinamide riboside transporter PnuC